MIAAPSSESGIANESPITGASYFEPRHPEPARDGRYSLLTVFAAVVVYIVAVDRSA
jgi:hypothetical protein